jgi:hypothetical protein
MVSQGIPSKRGAILNMPETLDLNKVVEDIVASYEVKIENIKSFFETTHLILNEFQDPLFDIKEERQVISAQLQDLLAKNEHLRRADFNWMMQGVLAIQIEKEKEIRNLVNSYLTEQKQMLNLLKDNLTKIKDALANGEGVGVKESQKLMVEILAQQDKRKQEVISKLKDFQKEQQEMAKRLLELLSKGRELRIKDLKSMLREFQAEHKERIAQQEERKVEVQKRRGEVHGMLVEFKKKRKESVKSWRTNSLKAIPPLRKAEETNENSKVSNEVNIDVVKDGVIK